MFLRRNRRLVDGEPYDYWTLVRTVRTAKGPRQEVVACLGKVPGLDPGVRQGWEALEALLDGHPPAPAQGQLALAAADTDAAAQPPPPPQWTQVDLRGLRIERVREFGRVYLGLALWRRLGLHTLLRELIAEGREEVSWELTACILTLARFCGQKSELAVAERRYADSALEQWMRGKGLGTCARQLLEEVATVRSLDVVLPVRVGETTQATDLRLRVVAKPDRPVAELLHQLRLQLPVAPKIVQNVVEKNGA